MKTLFLLAGLFLSGIGVAQESNVWSGRFDGTIVGINATITAQTNGAEWNGSVNASGYPLELKGTISENTCTGFMSDPQTQSSTPFTAKLEGARLLISIRDINPDTGLEEDLKFTFVKSDITATETSVLSQALNTNNLDPGLVGKWRYTETYVSGDFSVATDYFMQFKDDGIVYVTDGRTAGGDSNSSFDTNADDIHRGVWKTENSVLWINDGNSDWQPYARYYAEESRMMLTFGDGKKQVWERF